MRKIHAFAALALLVAAGAAASAITVTQRTDLLNVFAERYDLQQLLVLGPTSILPSPVGLTAAGTAALPVEIGTTMPLARTAVVRDHWTYSVDVKEASANALTSGIFAVTLHVDNAPLGTVYIEQASLNATVIEGARITFDLGPTLQPNALYYVEVKPHTPTGPTVAFTVRSITGPKWQGVGGAIDGVDNPGLALALGSTLRLTARNADGGFHDIGLRDAAGNLVNPPGWSADIDAVGEEVTLAWTPGATGTYSYVCKYHPTTMVGALTVTS